MDDNDVFQFLKQHVLFLVPLNNGDWMAGPGNAIYRLEITQDHYQDEALCISCDPWKAMRRMANKQR